MFLHQFNNQFRKQNFKLLFVQVMLTLWNQLLKLAEILQKWRLSSTKNIKLLTLILQQKYKLWKNKKECKTKTRHLTVQSSYLKLSKLLAQRKYKSKTWFPAYIPRLLNETHLSSFKKLLKKEFESATHATNFSQMNNTWRSTKHKVSNTK